MSYNCNRMTSSRQANQNESQLIRKYIMSFSLSYLYFLSMNVTVPVQLHLSYTHFPIAHHEYEIISIVQRFYRQRILVCLKIVAARHF